MLTYEQYQQSAAYIRQASGGFEPEILLVLGSGLGFLAEEIGEPIVIPYGQIPHFQTSTAPDHAGRFVLGTLAGRRVIAMQGRLHLYEGYTAQQVSYPVRVAKLLGAETMVVTNASGAINTGY